MSLYHSVKISHILAATTGILKILAITADIYFVTMCRAEKRMTKKKTGREIQGWVFFLKRWQYDRYPASKSFACNQLDVGDSGSVDIDILKRGGASSKWYKWH